MQPFHITKLVIIDHFTPRNQVRTSTHGVIPFKTVGTIGLNLPTDKAIRMLFGVEIIQRILEREETGSISGKHQNER